MWFNLLLFLFGGFFWFCFYYLNDPLSFQSGASLFATGALTHNDWYKELGYISVVQQSLRDAVLPFHVPSLVPFFEHVGSRFLGVPAWVMTPQILLLYFMDTYTFCFASQILTYAVGFYGCLLFKRHYRLGGISFSVLFLLFNFNGYFVTKISGGAPAYWGYYLIPFVLYIMMRVGESDTLSLSIQAKWGLLLSCALCGILYLGSLHLFVICVTFILFWTLFNWKWWKMSFLSLTTTFWIGAVRLLPAAVAANGHGASRARGQLGYWHPDLLVNALAVLESYATQPVKGAWAEFSLYISIVGLLFLVYFGLWAPFLRLPWVRSSWRGFVGPSLLLFILSLWWFKKYSFLIDYIPLLNVERVVSRYMVIPFLMVTLFAAVNLEGFLEKYGSWRRVRVVLLTALGFLTVSLLRYGFVWRMHRVYRDSLVFSKEEWLDPARHFVFQIQNNMTDVFYIHSFWAGLVLSLLGCAGLTLLLIRLRAV